MLHRGEVVLERPVKDIGDKEIPIRMSILRELPRRGLSLCSSCLFEEFPEFNRFHHHPSPSPALPYFPSHDFPPAAPLALRDLLSMRPAEFVLSVRPAT